MERGRDMLGMMSRVASICTTLHGSLVAVRSADGSIRDLYMAISCAVPCQGHGGGERGRLSRRDPLAIRGDRLHLRTIRHVSEPPEDLRFQA